MKIKPYILLGIILTAAGFALAVVSYFIIESVPLTSSGIFIIILGAICIGLAYSEPMISPGACEILMKTGVDNISAILEYLDVNNKAIYLPRSMRAGRSQALIPFPIVREGDKNKIMEELSGNLIVKWTLGSGCMALAVTTMGNVCLEKLKTIPEPTKDGIESTLKHILTQELDLASGVKVDMGDSQINIEVRGPKMKNEDTLFYRCLGSPVASIVAAFCSEALEKTISIKEEVTLNTKNKKKIQIILEILS
jgi:hypothetical protein